MYSLFYYRIPFSEVDAMGIVHHSNHARYFERARVDYLRLIDLNYLELTKRGMHYPLTDMSCSFKRPLKFDDIIVVESKIVQLSRTRLSYSYRILGAEKLEEGKLTTTPVEGETLVIGRTDHCCVNDGGRPMLNPPDVLAILKKYFPENAS